MCSPHNNDKTGYIYFCFLVFVLLSDGRSLQQLTGVPKYGIRERRGAGVGRGGLADLNYPVSTFTILLDQPRAGLKQTRRKNTPSVIIILSFHAIFPSYLHLLHSSRLFFLSANTRGISRRNCRSLKTAFPFTFTYGGRGGDIFVLSISYPRVGLVITVFVVVTRFLFP